MKAAPLLVVLLLSAPATADEFINIPAPAVDPTSAAATKVEMKRAFYPAERYHQDYLPLHPREPYIMYNDIPKVEALAAMHPDYYRADPALVYPKKK